MSLNQLLFAGASAAIAAVVATRKQARAAREKVVQFAMTVPKAELHLHIEGTFEPELMFAIAKRNGLDAGYPSIEAARAARNFGDLQSFLDIYYAACAVLLKEEDFYDLTMAYFRRAHKQGLRHVEMFFDPQTHTERGVDMATVVGGLRRAITDAQSEMGISGRLIMCFLRHLTEEDAFATLEAVEPFKEHITGIGLDSGEAGNPPAKFERVFARARDMGLRVVAHAGEEGPAAFIAEALDSLHVERVDHGVRCLEDDAVVDRLVREKVPLTVCPLSNHCLQVSSRYFGGVNVVKRLLRRGLHVTVNSDDPAYFGGYVGDNFVACVKELGLSAEEVIALAENSFKASFIGDDEKAAFIAEVRAHAERVL